MHAPSSIPFDLTGEFGGLVFTETGKRRLLLRVGDGQERLLKVPKFLRRLVVHFQLGQTVRVGGVEERDFLTGTSKWVVSTVLPAEGAPPSAAPPSPAGLAAGGAIKVCAKKNCWRQGGREIFAALERGLAARGLGDRVKVKAVGCLDRCKQGPNVDWGDRELTRCTGRDAEAMLAAAGPVIVPRS